MSSIRGYKSLKESLQRADENLFVCQMVYLMERCSIVCLRTTCNHSLEHSALTANQPDSTWEGKTDQSTMVLSERKYSYFFKKITWGKVLQMFTVRTLYLWKITYYLFLYSLMSLHLIYARDDRNKREAGFKLYPPKFKHPNTFGYVLLIKMSTLIFSFQRECMWITGQV